MAQPELPRAGFGCQDFGSNVLLICRGLLRAVPVPRAVQIRLLSAQEGWALFQLS